MSEWEKYKPGMKIDGRDMKVGGKPRTHLVDREYHLPAGLFGHCISQHSGRATIRFARTEGGNLHLWSLITHSEDKQSSRITIKMDSVHLRHMLVGDLIPEDVQQRTHALLRKQGPDVPIKSHAAVIGNRG